MSKHSERRMLLLRQELELRERLAFGDIPTGGMGQNDLASAETCEAMLKHLDRAEELQREIGRLRAIQEEP